ncbi:hypothetical protein AB0M95_39350 [Sphaerisporangium sp. NPDC051017]|uniref:hypothetical protein n=1 Tax=Sphaerisporangium sp. NPDC051017 TaxID=3154636 RepID=UPI003414838A
MYINVWWIIMVVGVGGVVWLAFRDDRWSRAIPVGIAFAALVLGLMVAQSRVWIFGEGQACPSGTASESISPSLDDKKVNC